MERYHYHKEFHKHRGNLQKNVANTEGHYRQKDYPYIREFLVDDKNIQEEKMIADKCNDYFTNRGPELAKEIPEVTEKPEDYLSGTFKNYVFSTCNHR